MNRLPRSQKPTGEYFILDINIICSSLPAYQGHTKQFYILVSCSSCSLTELVIEKNKDISSNLFSPLPSDQKRGYRIRCVYRVNNLNLLYFKDLIVNGLSFGKIQQKRRLMERFCSAGRLIFRTVFGIAGYTFCSNVPFMTRLPGLPWAHSELLSSLISLWVIMKRSG